MRLSEILSLKTHAEFRVLLLGFIVLLLLVES